MAGLMQTYSVERDRVENYFHRTISTTRGRQKDENTKTTGHREMAKGREHRDCPVTSTYNSKSKGSWVKYHKPTQLHG